MTSSHSRALIGAALVFSLALFAFGRALLRAIDVDTGSPAPLPALIPSEAVEQGPTLSAEALMLAVESDPFQPERTRPAERYRLPGEEEPPPPPEPPAPPPAPDLKLAGTVVFEGGGMALLQNGAGDQRLLNIGEGMGGYRLSRVTNRAAVLENAFGEVTLMVASPPQTIASDDGDRDDRRNRRGRESNDERQEALQREVMQQLIRRAREGGASRQQLQMLERMMQRGGNPRELMEMFQRVMRSGADEFIEVVPERARMRAVPMPPPPPPPVPPSTR